MKIKFFAGTTTYWGFGIDFCPWDKSFTIAFIHWYVAVEFWTTK